MTEQPSITCPKCKLVSYNENDIKHRFCDKCGYHDVWKPPNVIKLRSEPIQICEYGCPTGSQGVQGPPGPGVTGCPTGPTGPMKSIDLVAKDTYEVSGGPLHGLVLKKIPDNPTPAEEKAIIDAGVAFIMGDPPPETPLGVVRVGEKPADYKGAIPFASDLEPPFPTRRSETGVLVTKTGMRIPVEWLVRTGLAEVVLIEEDGGIRYRFKNTLSLAEFEQKGYWAVGTMRAADTFCDECDIFGHAEDSPACLFYQDDWRK